jgi:biofilm protein TabA
MIYDRKENLLQYKGISKNLDRAIDYLAETDFTGMDAGKYPVDGERVFLLVQTPDSRPKTEARWETHQRYLDIQYLIDGEEIIGFQKADKMTVSEPYKQEQDVAFYEDNGKGFFPELTADSFVICFPTDAHMPLICAEVPRHIKKVVVKVEV